MKLKPFLQYYGGKWRAAPHYPPPRFSRIIEPFAGAAGYSLRYAHLNVTLVEKYPVVAGIWRYLIAVKPSEVRRIPNVENVKALPDWVPQEARWLVGFWMNGATTEPCVSLSAWCRYGRARSWRICGWGSGVKERIAAQVEAIRHWKIHEGDYTDAPADEATWFIDPPYDNEMGRRYPCRPDDYAKLSQWCKRRKGQVIVCENEGASWLPFKRLGTFKAGVKGFSREVIWVNR